MSSILDKKLCILLNGTNSIFQKNDVENII